MTPTKTKLAAAILSAAFALPALQAAATPEEEASKGEFICRGDGPEGKGAESRIVTTEDGSLSVIVTYAGQSRSTGIYSIDKRKVAERIAKHFCGNKR